MFHNARTGLLNIFGNLECTVVLFRQLYVLVPRYVMSLAVANLGGRIVWAGVSDRIGCRATFHILTIRSEHVVPGCTGTWLYLNIVRRVLKFVFLCSVIYSHEVK